MKKIKVISLILPVLFIILSVQNAYAGGTVSLTGNPYVGNDVTLSVSLDTHDCPTDKTEFKILHLNVEQIDASSNPARADPTTGKNIGNFPLDFSNSEIHTLVNGNNLGGFKYYSEQQFIVWFPNYPPVSANDHTFLRNDNLQVVVSKVKVVQPGKANINATLDLDPDWDTCVGLHSYSYTYDFPNHVTWVSYNPLFTFTFYSPPSATPTPVPTSTPTPTNTPSPTPTPTTTPSPTPYFGSRFPTLPPLRWIIFPTISLFPKNTPTPSPINSPTQTPIVSPTITPFSIRHLSR